MKQILIIITLLAYALSFGQIEIKIISLNKSSEEEKLSISITNVTDSYYAIPFDKHGFRGFNSEEVCNDLKTLDYPYNFFALSLIFKDKFKNEPENSLIRGLHLERLDQKETEKIKLKNQRRHSKILDWKNKNQFKSDLEAERNFYIINNILLLSPKETKIINIEMNVFEIMRGDTMFYDYYNLENNKKYNFSLQLCADNTIYSYLTEKQKSQLKKYIFFSGKIESNIIPYIFNYK